MFRVQVVKGYSFHGIQKKILHGADKCVIIQFILLELKKVKTQNRMAIVGYKSSLLADIPYSGIQNNNICRLIHDKMTFLVLVNDHT